LNDHKTFMYVNCMFHYFFYFGGLLCYKHIVVLQTYFRVVAAMIFLCFFCGANSCVVRFIVEVSRSHTDTCTFPVGLLWKKKNWSSVCNTKQTQETNILVSRRVWNPLIQQSSGYIPAP
jgi:hypothetical protein